MANRRRNAGCIQTHRPAAVVNHQTQVLFFGVRRQSALNYERYVEEARYSAYDLSVSVEREAPGAGNGGLAML
jgi:ribosome biogenesis protein Nip4